MKKILLNIALYVVTPIYTLCMIAMSIISLFVPYTGQEVGIWGQILETSHSLKVFIIVFTVLLVPQVLGFITREIKYKMNERKQVSLLDISEQ